VDRGEEVVGPVPIGAEKFRLIPGGSHPGHVKDRVLISHGEGQSGLVVEVSLNLPDAESIEESCFAGRADQRGDFVPVPNQGFDEVAPNEPRRPGHQRLHTGRSYMR
jgi:hypothetical protein